MRRILSTKYSTGAFNLAMLVLRLGVGVLVASHGFGKLAHFSSTKHHFLNFLGYGFDYIAFAGNFCGIFLFHIFDPGFIYAACGNTCYYCNVGSVI